MSAFAHSDVVIVGAGPAGSLAAYILASRGISVRIIDRAPFPRYKPCGGGVTEQALRMLPFAIDEVVEDRSVRPVIRVGERTIFDATLDTPVIHMVMRDRLDAFLVEKAVSQGAHFTDATAFLSVSGRPGDLRVTTSTGELRTRVLVGADGVTSRVGRALRLNPQPRIMGAIQAELVCRHDRNLAAYRGKVCFDFGVVPKGYGWIFPKAKHLSVGILSTDRHPRGLMDQFRKYLNACGLSNDIASLRLRGYRIPYSPVNPDALAGDRGLLIGDAAGITDPVTGEGIHYAFKTAAIAAEVIRGTLEGRLPGLPVYARRVRAEVLRDLTAADRLARVFYAVPKLNALFFRTYGERGARYYLDIIQGKRGFREVFRRLFHPAQLAAVFCRLAVGASATFARKR